MDRVPLKLDPTYVAGLSPYPVSLPDAIVPGAVALALSGELSGGARYEYGFELRAEVSYRFSSDSSAVSLLLIDMHSGEVLWGNASGLAGIGVDATVAAAWAESHVSALASTQAALVVTSLSGDSIVPVGFEFRVDSQPDPLTLEEVFRFRNVESGSFLYTASEAERDFVLASLPFLSYEGVAFMAEDVQRPGWIPVHRYARTDRSDWVMVIDDAEKHQIDANPAQFVYEGVAFFVPPPSDPSSTPVYRLEQLDTGVDFLTTDPVERLYRLLQANWSDEGVAFAAALPPAPGSGEADVTDAAPVGLVGSSGIPAPDLIA